MREIDVVFQCLEVLRRRSIYCFRVNCGAFKVKDKYGVRTVRTTSVDGVADILGITPSGRFVAVEVLKRPGGTPTPEQRDFIDSIRRRAGIALVVYRSSDLAEIIDRELRKDVA